MMDDEMYEMLDKVELKYGEDSDEAAEAGFTINQISSELRELKENLRALLKAPNSQ